jgi:hypothetical protein
MLDTLTSASFQPLLHQSFEIRMDGSDHTEQPRAFDLIEVADLGDATVADRDRRHPFSLVFREAGRAYLPQNIYRLDHPALGSLDLFLVPIGPDHQGMLYQAIFN